MAWQRARQPGQKAERVTAILDSAGALFDEKDLTDISMRDLAAAAGLSKASLYSYFKTKEEVFATLFLSEIDDWFAVVETKLKRLRAPNAERVAKLLTDALRDRQRFCRLGVVLASILERNMSREFIRDFKLRLNTQLQQVVVVFQTIFPSLGNDAAIAFLYQHQSLIAGLWPLTHPSPEMAEVLAAEEFQEMQVDFFDLFRASIQQLLRATE